MDTAEIYSHKTAIEMIEPTDELVAALQKLSHAASAFALHAGRHYAKVNPTDHARLIALFNEGLAEMHIGIQMSPEMNIRLAFQIGETEDVIFDSIRAATPPGAGDKNE